MKYTKIEQYTEMIKDAINNLEIAFQKINIGINLSVYKSTLENDLKSKYNKFNILAEDEIQEFLTKKTNKFNLFKINLNEDTNIIAFTNSTYYENTNKTLPLGMNVEEAVLLNIKELKLELKEEKEVNIVCFENPEDELSKTNIKQINIKEYNIVK